MQRHHEPAGATPIPQPDAAQAHAGGSKVGWSKEEGASFGEYSDGLGTTERRLLLSRAASQALRPGRRYRVRITEVRTGPEPDTASSAELVLEVT